VKEIRYSVGIPVFNEEEILEDNVRTLRAYLQTIGQPFEIIIGSNGSNDSTVAIGERLAGELEEVSFFHIEPRDLGRVFKMFVERARADALVSLDADLSIDLEFVRQAIDMLDTFDVVVGSKKTGSQDRSMFRRFGSSFFIAVATTLLRLDIVDYSIGAKAYRISAVRRYLPHVSEGTAYVLDLVYFAQRDGGRVAQIPVFCSDHRVSKFNLGLEASHKFLNLARLWWRRNVEIPD
jgi:glycosyltransferase involved in cell wall biosynthesis